MPPVSIVIPAYNQLDYCRQCLDSIQVNTEPGTYRLVLVNNGSDDGVGAYFDSIEGAAVIHAEENLGFAGGVNLGLAKADGHALILNSDTLVPRDWLPRLVAALERDTAVGIVGPMSNYVSGPQLVPDLEFTSMDEINAYSDRLHDERRGQFEATDRLVGFCMLIKDKALNQVPQFDEQFGIGNYEDDDYGIRVRKAGFELRIALDCFVFHYGHRTFAGMGVHNEALRALLDENGERFREKWKTSPEFDRAAARDTALSLNRDARGALETGDLKAGISLLAKAIRTSPELAENYNDLGAVLWEMGERRRATALFERALALNPNYAEAADNLDAAKRTDVPDRSPERT